MNLRLNCLLAVTLLFMSAAIAEDDIEDTEDGIRVEVPPEDDILYTSPEIPPPDQTHVYFAEHFDIPEAFNKKWVKSQAKKDGMEEEIAKYDGEWAVENPVKDGLKGDLGMVLKTKAKHAAISARTKPIHFNDEPIIVQYEVVLQEGQECGGAYLKLLSEDFDLKQFTDKSPYAVMFGPDKCGNDYKLHFIFKHKNPLNGTVEEKHCQKPKERLEEIYDDKLPHLYTLIMNPDNTFEIRIDNKVVNSGSLLEDFAPPVNPPAEIEDPTDVKPDDWDEREKIPDPDAVKPDDWDEDAPAQIVDETAVVPDGWLENEPTHIPDPEAKKPVDWDTDMDGEWEPPLIENPACENAAGCGPWEPPLVNNPKFKGKWRPPYIDNPNYKGKWRPRLIPNPDYFEDKHPFKLPTVHAIGFELWSMSKNILFDNIIITNKVHVAEYWATQTFAKKRLKIAQESASLWGRMMRAMNYRPKTWAAYIIYCSIPIIIYIWYLYTCVKEESFIQKLANFTNEYPLMWGLYIVVLGIPVALMLFLCFRPSSASQKEKEEINLLAEKKKTDEVTEDNAEGVEDRVEDEEDDEDAEKNSEPDSEEDNDAVDDNVPDKSAGEGTRKRKLRKD